MDRLAALLPAASRRVLPSRRAALQGSYSQNARRGAALVCGGRSHYATAASAPSTMGGSSKLDKLKAMQKEGKKGIV